MATFRDWFVRAAVVLAVLIPLYFAYAALGARFGLHDWRFGMGTLMRDIGPKVLLAGLGFGFVAMCLALLVKPRRGFAAALLAFLIPAAGLGYGAYSARQAGAIPPIHDISTDLADPPIFSVAVFQARGPEANPVDLANKRVPATWRNPAFADQLSTDVQRQSYPDITPVPLGVAPAEAYQLALAAAQAQPGWVIGDTLAPAPGQDGRIEATARSFWFGFTDDIVVRVRATDQGSVVDVRSTSRVGISDLGANAKRVRAYTATLVASLQRH
jgi:uncharacterized protein (DUF1499 family)